MWSARLSMKSFAWRLNEVRPRRPEQYSAERALAARDTYVSMKSGLEGRNNTTIGVGSASAVLRLNEVRPRRPEQ